MDTEQRSDVHLHVATHDGHVEVLPDGDESDHPQSGRLYVHARDDHLS
jgi:hypothetical protein